MRSVTARPAEVNGSQAAISVYGANMICSWRDILQRLDHDYGWESPEFINSMTTLWLEDENQRVELLQKLAPEGQFSVVADGDIVGLKTIINQFYKASIDVDSQEAITNGAEAVGVLTEAYQGFINIDLESFSETLEAQLYLDEQSEQVTDNNGKLKRVTSQLGEYAFDALKIAAGVSLGIVVGSLFKRKY